MDFVVCFSSDFVLRFIRAQQMAESMIKVIQRAKSGSVWVAEYGEDPYEIEYTNRDNIRRINS